MSLLTKMREYMRVPFIWAAKRFAPSRRRGPGGDLPPGPDGSAGVPAKLPPRVPILAGGNARPWPPEEEVPPPDAVAS